MVQTHSGTSIASHIEHTALRPDTTMNDIEMLCREARHFDFYGVCIPPVYVRHARELLENSDKKIITVIGFPLGYSTQIIKEAELAKAIADGADEMDVVCNISLIKSGKFDEVKEEITCLTNLTHDKQRFIKLILETNLLNEEEIKRLCDICITANVDCLKTCTGFSGSVRLETIQLLSILAPENMLIKAAGGIKTKTFALDLIAAGAERIGTSSGVEIMEDP